MVVEQEPAGEGVVTEDRPGRLSRLVTRMFMKQARVVKSQTLASGFHLITLQSEDFKGIAWAPGQKLQISMGSAFQARTFTPMLWDGQTGQTSLLGYAHGNGPGSSWLSNTRVGAQCDVFGPHASTRLDHTSGKLVLLGDETSLALAYAICHHEPGLAMQGLFEVTAMDPAQQIIIDLKIGGITLFERTESDSHLAEMERKLLELASTGSTFVLTGRAPMIQRLRRNLQHIGVPKGRLIAKPYWAPGKTGLD